MKRFLFLICFVIGSALSDAAELQSPLLFVKRFNYQGLHIYDSFYQWRPGGGIYVLENPADPKEQHRIRPVIDPTTDPTLGEGIYSSPSLSYDAQKLLFCFKGSPNGNTTIYEIGVDGKGLRQITNLDHNGNPYKGSSGGHHDVQPSYLPDGRIVFCSTRYSGLVPCANNGVAILHVCNADGSDVHTLSVNNVTEFNPTALPDGRILFGRWEYIDKNALTIQSIWTVLPDGTNETALFANNMVFPEAVLQAKPVPGSDHLIVASFTPHNSPPRGSIAMIDTQKGKNDPQAIYNFEHPDKPLFDRGDSCDPTALDSNTVLYSGIPNDPDAPTIPVETKPFRKRNTPKLNALMLIDRTGKKTVIYSDPAIDLHDPIPVLPRPLPPIASDTTNRSKITGNFFVQNVYANMPQVPKGSIKYLRVIEETSRVSESPGGTWMNQTFSISAALAWSPKIFHGIVPVEEDGSVYFEAPSGRALYFQLLDKDYKLVRSMRTFIQAVPGTTRSCIGCHEYDSAPRSASPAFTGKQPKQLTDESWGSGYIDYASMIQPIFDKKCVSCHGGEKALAGGLDLTGGRTEYFCNSYESLTARREKQYIADLIAGVCCMNGTADYSCRIFEPYQHGSGKAPLAEILLKEPHLSAVGLTKKEQELILAWIDTNGLYFGTWDYTTCSKPAIKEYAPLRAALINVMKKNQCAKCHTNDKGEVARFDNWINLERPELSVILRAPLAASETVQDGFGLGLCRDRKIDPAFSRRGTMFKAGYAHQVLPLDRFPSQKWQNWQEVHAGEPVITFASTNDAVYQEMLALITAAGQRQLTMPRIDMPGAGRFAVSGRSRQIIPQPLPETMPPLFAERTSEKSVRLSWECSCRTIGLITEIHRSGKPDFKPTSATLIGKTERFEFFDDDVPNGDVYYAMVFVSDPAATCGTCKSGATLDYNHSAVNVVPAVRRIEDRCPLSMVEPMRSEPSQTVRAE